MSITQKQTYRSFLNTENSRTLNNIPAAGQIITIKTSKYTWNVKTNEEGIASLGIHFKPGTWNVKVSINIAGVSKTKNAKIVVKKANVIKSLTINKKKFKKP